jgi:2-polyprenyl-3-methyl-5-hydroxy-6-metoxy-1,4-benzoquinol methylase
MEYRKIYEDAFSDPKYNDDPGADKYQFVLQTYKNHLSKRKFMIDIGSGKGYMLWHLLNSDPSLNITAIDIKNFVDQVDNNKFIFHEQDITKDHNLVPFPLNDILTCLDVLEHLEKDKMDDIVKWLSRVARVAYITVGNHHDIINGVELHPTREKLPYWQGLMEKYFTIIRMEDREDIWYSFELKSKEYK